jgi:hypothetical protein
MYLYVSFGFCVRVNAADVDQQLIKLIDGARRIGMLGRSFGHGQIPGLS